MVGEDGQEMRKAVNRVCLPRFSPIAVPILQQGESDLALNFPFALLRPWVPGACFDFALVQKVVSAIPTGLWKCDIGISVFKYLVYLCGHRC